MFAVHIYIPRVADNSASAKYSRGGGDKVTESLGSVKGSPTLPLVAVCALSSILLSVRVSLCPPLFFSPLFFLFFQRFLLERVQVDGRFLLLLSDARLFPSKKKTSSHTLTKATLFPFSLKLL